MSDNAEVYDKAWVYDKAKVHGEARVYGYAQISDEAEMTHEDIQDRVWEWLEVDENDLHFSETRERRAEEWAEETE